MHHPKLSQFLSFLLSLVLLTNCVPAQPTASTPSSPANTSAPVLPTAAVFPTAIPTATQESPETIVQQMVSAKLKAMEEKDIDQYLSLINDADKEFYTEQRNWFLIYQDAVTSDFSIKVQKVERLDQITLAATLTQHYLYGPQKDSRTITYQEKFIQTPDGWKDADLNFEVVETPHFNIKYQKELAAKIAEVSEEAERAYESVTQKLEIEVSEKIPVKLYASQELLRQSSDIRVAYLFNGWNEDGESIKLYGFRDRAAFAPVIAHEMVHKITLEITDSLNSWLAEGLAMYFGSQPFRGGDPIEARQFSVEGLAKPITWLEENNLIELTDGETIRLYYAVSEMVVEFLVKTYGLDKLKAILTELSKNPKYDRGFDYGAMEIENQKRLHQAVQTVLGMDQSTFNQQWLDWIRSQKQ